MCGGRGVWTPCIHHGAANALPTIRVDSTHKGLYVWCAGCCWERRVQGQGSRVEGVHGGWDPRGTTAALWLLRVSASLRVSD